MSSKRPPVSLARRVWPAVAVAGASAAFVTALDRPTQFISDTVSLTGSQDSAVPATLLPAVDPTTTVAGQPVNPVAVTTIPPIPVSVPAPKTTTKAATTPAPAPAAGAGACTGQAINGPVVQTRWGPVQVQAQLTAAHRVCNVIALQTPNSHNRSVQINNYAKPILHKRAIAAGSAQFNGVSGATITSRGYQASLQYVIDHA
ncbi:unannotated protein [freshwater metagenome]|uniref:Unannotated protein n=1 Tax=freshwater metagenome TaxID=449393 RepID=A0A6J7F0I7_9ZZZZ|nr:FMN-binding protein [Actinomycetota bacterium]